MGIKDRNPTFHIQPHWCLSSWSYNSSNVRRAGLFFFFHFTDEFTASLSDAVWCLKGTSDRQGKQFATYWSNYYRSSRKVPSAKLALKPQDLESGAPGGERFLTDSFSRCLRMQTKLKGTWWCWMAILQTSRSPTVCLCNERRNITWQLNCVKLCLGICVPEVSNETGRNLHVWSIQNTNPTLSHINPRVLIRLA